MRVAERDPADEVVDSVAAERQPRGLPTWVALLLGLVAVGSAVLLPLAPVEMSSPTVSWPQDPTAPSSTMLELDNGQPLSLDAGFTCRAVRAAGAAGGVVLSTMVPASPSAGTDGLLVSTTGGRLTVLDRGRTVLDEPVPAGDCRYAVRVDADRLTVDRDGTAVADLAATPDAAVLPVVDVLATDAKVLPGTDDLAVRVRVDNQFDTTPAPLKKVLVALSLVAALGSLVALRRREGRADRLPEDRPRLSGAARAVVVLVDVGVLATLVLWLFIAPMSDDDGYYAAMARNSRVEGFVGNYYQLFNQSFTPFTWFYRVLGWWEGVGNSVVLLRIPALVVGVITWLLMRRYVRWPAAALPAGAAARPWVRAGTVLLLGLAFLAWWLPYGMGVRPEAVVAVLALATMSCVAAGLRRHRLLPIAIGVGLAGLALACPPTGFVAFAPLVVSLPRILPMLRADGGAPATLTRSLLVLAPGAFPAAAVFADGSLNDFLRGQQIFLSFQAQNTWYDEWQRYMFLLSPGPMGSYARRAAVLLGIVALLWFLVLAVAARVREVAVPPALRLAGLTLGAAFLLLWLTPSKWTHHFGALSGIGPVFLALFLAGAPALVGELTRDRRPGWPVPLAALGSAVVAFALAFQGLNQWAYTWLPGMPHANVPPSVGPVSFGSLLVWAVVAAAAVLAVRYTRRRGRPPRRAAWAVAVPLLVTVYLVVELGYLVGSFGYATIRTLDTWSPWADAISDPLAQRCDAARAGRGTDRGAARPAAVAVPAPAPAAPFVPGTGWFAADPPPGTVGQGAVHEVWGSLGAPGAEDLTGQMTTSWYSLPQVGDDEALTVLAAGRLAQGNRLTVEYGARQDGGEPTVVRSEPLVDATDAPTWRTFVLDAAAARRSGADVVRVVADDVSGGEGGWLAFSAPSVSPVVPFQDLVPHGSAVGLAWQIAFLFPCQRQPVIRDGITEPVRYGVVWVDNPTTSGIFDATWQPGRGLFGPVHRTSSITRLGTSVLGSPGVQTIQAYEFDLPYPVRDYVLRTTREQRWGWQGP